MWLASFVAVSVPLLGLVAAVLFLWGRGFSWVDLGLLLGMYILTAVGITVGYHLLFTHRALETTPVPQFLLGSLGSMAVAGPRLKTLALHPRPPPHTDQPSYPH